MKNVIVLEDIEYMNPVSNMKYRIHDNPKSLFHFYFPKYNNEKPILIPIKMIEEMRNFGYPRHVRNKFKKLMNSNDKTVREKGLKLIFK